MRYYLIASAMWLLHLLPAPVLALLGKIIGNMAYYIAKKRRDIGLTNMKLCFPHWSAHQQQQIIKRHFQYLSTALLEYGILWFASSAYLKKFIRVEGIEHYIAVKDKPVILFAPHFVGLDMGGLRFSMQYIVSSMYSNQKNSSFNKLLLRGRSRFNKPLLFSRQDGILPIIRALRQGIACYYLPDQDLGAKHSIFVPFFEIETATTNTMSRLAKLTDAVIVPVITRRMGNGYVMRYYPAWENFPSDDLYTDAKRINAFIEERVKEMPAQYFWLHRRFKTRPAGEKPIYS